MYPAEASAEDANRTQVAPFLAVCVRVLWRRTAAESSEGRHSVPGKCASSSCAFAVDRESRAWVKDCRPAQGGALPALNSSGRRRKQGAVQDAASHTGQANGPQSRASDTPSLFPPGAGAAPREAEPDHKGPCNEPLSGPSASCASGGTKAAAATGRRDRHKTNTSLLVRHLLIPSAVEGASTRNHEHTH